MKAQDPQGRSRERTHLGVLAAWQGKPCPYMAILVLCFNHRQDQSWTPDFSWVPGWDSCSSGNGMRGDRPAGREAAGLRPVAEAAGI